MPVFLYFSKIKTARVLQTPGRSMHKNTRSVKQGTLDQLTPAAVKSVHTVLRLILNRAVDLDYIPRNPALKCILPMRERKEIQPLDDGQAAALIRAAAGTRIEFMIPLALFTGMRLSELLGLTWDAVDMDRDTITISACPSTPVPSSGFFPNPFRRDRAADRSAL